MRIDWRLLLFAYATSCGVGAGSFASDGGGAHPDGGGPRVDGGAAPDAGAVDAGAEADAGTPDAGAHPPRPSGPYPHNGWEAPAAPNGRVVGLDLASMDEDELLRSGGKAALLAVGRDADDYHPEREPLVLVHGITGQPSDLQPLVDRFWSWRYQLYVLTYNDYQRRTSLNGIDLAEELRALATRLPSFARDVTLLGHSLGGIVVRRALNELAVGAGDGIDLFTRVRFFGADNPWHGYDGPADGPLMDLVRPFMPDGLEDMRALSGMFQGIPESSDSAERAGLLDVSLPSSVAVHLVFAENGDEVLDYTEGVLAALPEKLVAHYRDGVPVDGDPKLVLFWKALRASVQLQPFEADVRALPAPLDANAVRAALERHFPKLPGDHTGMLSEQPGRTSFLDWLADRLR